MYTMKRYNPVFSDKDAEKVGFCCLGERKMKKSIMISLLIAFMTPFLSSVSLAMLTPAVDGHYSSWEYVCCDNFDGDSYVRNTILVVPYYSSNHIWCGRMCDEGYSASFTNGIIEFNTSSVEGLFTSGQMGAVLSLTVQGGDLPDYKCLALYSIQDVNENGVIEKVDINTDDFIGELCEDLQLGDIITFDVTAAIEHDLFDPDQTDFSGFILRSSDLQDSEDWITFYDHTDPDYAPRLSISEPLCPVTAIYGEHSEQTELLRSLRDNLLSKTQAGKELIKLYYQWSPVIVKALEADEDFKEDVKALVDGVLGMVE